MTFVFNIVTFSKPTLSIYLQVSSSNMYTLWIFMEVLGIFWSPTANGSWAVENPLLINFI